LDKHVCWELFYQPSTEYSHKNQITFDIDIFSDTDNDAGENPTEL